MAETALSQQVDRHPAPMDRETTAIAHEELLRAAMEAAQLGTWYRHIAEDRVEWGGHATELLASAEQLTDFGQVVNAIHPDDQCRFLQTIDAARRSGEPFSLETRVVHPSGEVRWVAIWGHYVRDETGVAIRSVGAFRDITDRRLLEQQLAQTHRVEAIGHLAAGIAHEINTPTQYAGDNLCFLEEGFRQLVTFLHQQTAVLDRSGIAPEDAARLQSLADEIDLHFLVTEIPRALSQAREGVRRVGEIVSAVKSFAHPGSGEREPTDLNAIVATTLALSRNEWKYVAATATDLEPDLPTVPCFRSEIQQAVLALIIHAAHAVADTSHERPGGEPGQINIRTRSAGADIELSVSDTGPGIPDAVKPRVFDPFFSIREGGLGSGQGLSFVYDVVVKKHGGSIRFESEVGRGTTFYLRLPQAGTPQEAS